MPLTGEAKRESDRAYERRHRERRLAAKRLRRQNIRAMVRKAKSQPCADCGGSFPSVCMDFDHRAGETKRFNIALCVDRYSLASLRDEIAKCDVVCSNCHRIRTAKRRSS